MGQETLAKLYNLDAVKQQLWGIAFPLATEAPKPGDAVQDSAAPNDRIGTVTSVTTAVDRSPFALAYVKSKSHGAQVNLQGLQVSYRLMHAACRTAVG